jgi:hypothetical protein
VFENRVLVRHIGSKERLNDRRLERAAKHNLYSSPNIIRMAKLRKVRLAWHVARLGEKRKANGLLLRKKEGKRPVGRPRHRWLKNINGS